MAVASVTRRWSGRPMDIGLRGIVEVRDSYDVVIEAESGVDPRQMIRESLGLTIGSVELPQRGYVHPEIAGMTCRTISLQPAGGPTRWFLEATYSNSQSNNQTDDPTLEPPEIEFGGVDEQVEIDTDLDGTPVATSAGEPFEQGLVVPRTDIALSYSFNVPASALNITWLLEYANSVNSDSWNGALPGEALINGPVQARYVYATDVIPAYWQVRMEILVRKNSSESGAPPGNAWRRRVLNQGMRYLDADNKLKLFTDKDGLPLNRPSLLDLSGKPSTAPTWRWFRVYKSVPFAPLAIVLP